MKYEQYKPTGIFWLPQIPVGWDCLLLSQTAKEQCEKKPAGEIFTVMSLSYGNVIRKKNIDAGLVPASYDNYQVIYAGNIILRLTDLQNDHTSLRTGLVKETGIITSAYTCLAPVENSAYLQYLLHSYDTRKVFYGMGGGVRQSIGYKDIRSMKVPIPPRAEQDQIVRYLDWQVSKINKLIAAMKREIELLKELSLSDIEHVVTRGIDSTEFCDSGIDYIGMVPKHWKVVQNRRIFREQSRKFSGFETVLSLSQKDGLIPYAEMTERSLHTASYDNWKLVYPNDLVLNRFKAHLGVFFASQYQGIVTFHYGVFEPKQRAISKYYEALYHTPRYRQVFAGRSNGMTVGLQNLSNQNFYTVYTLLPPLSEQSIIVDRVNIIEKQYMSRTKSIVQSLDALYALRSRLISDVVTGQIDVRDIEIPAFDRVEESAAGEDEPDEDGVLEESDEQEE